MVNFVCIEAPRHFATEVWYINATGRFSVKVSSKTISIIAKIWIKKGPLEGEPSKGPVTDQIISGTMLICLKF